MCRWIWQEIEKMTVPLKIICCYAGQDEKYFSKLEKHLSFFIRKKHFEIWHKQETSAGANWENLFDRRLNEADIIILLISIDFLSSDFCYAKTMEHARKRHESGEARVICILIRACAWEYNDFLERLQILPRETEKYLPVSSWSNEDDAWTYIVKDIYKSSQDWLNERDPLRKLSDSAVKSIEIAQYLEASSDKILAYYKGEAPLSWGILLARGDVERDIYEEIIRSATLSDRTTMVCLYGAGGLGKSTLAWRVAIDVAEKKPGKLLSIDNEEIGDQLGQLGTILQEHPTPVVVLIDDVFRDSTAWERLTSLDLKLPVTIITTSRENELPQDRLEYPHFAFCKVTGPTVSEKKRLLEKLSEKRLLNEEQLEATRRKRLEKATSWVLAMLEITTGQDQQDIFKNTIRRLKDRNKFIHRAYGYLCFAGKYDLGVPETLLAIIEPQAREISEYEDTRGIVFKNERGEICTQHSTIASEFFALYKQEEQKTLRDFIDAVDVDIEDHRWFLLHLCRAYSIEKRVTLLYGLLNNNARKIDLLLEAAGGGELLYGWVQFYRQIGILKKARELEEAVLTKELKTSLDCHACFNLLKDSSKVSKGQAKSIVTRVRGWLSKHDEETDVRAQLLGVALQFENSELLKCLIDETSKWLERYDNDVNTRQAYLGLFRSQKWDTKEQERKVFEQTEAWLKKKEHRDNTTVRQAFLGFVQRRIINEQVLSNVIEDTALWLREEAHKKNANVRQTYLELVSSKSVSRKQKEEAIDSTRMWLEENPGNNSVYQAYLKLVKIKGTPTQARKTLNTTIQQITKSSKEIHMRVEEYRKIAKEGSQEQIENAIEEISLWVEGLQSVDIRAMYRDLKEQYHDIEHARHILIQKINKLEKSEEDANDRVKRLKEASKGGEEEVNKAIGDALEYRSFYPDDTNILKVFLGLIEQQGDKERMEVVIKDVRVWLATHLKDGDVRARWLSLVGRCDNDKQKHAAIEDTVTWLSRNSEDVNVRQAYLKIVGLWGTEGQLQHAFTGTKAWLARHPDNSTVRHAYLGLVKQRFKKDEPQVREVIEETRLWLTKYRKNTSVRQTYLGLIRAKGDSDEIRRTIEETEIWLDDYPENANVLQTYLELIAEKGTKDQKQGAREKVKSWLDKHPENTNVLQSSLKIIGD
jgi:hypothetical protein